jgi:hypothetical protein
MYFVAACYVAGGATTMTTAGGCELCGSLQAWIFAGASDLPSYLPTGQSVYRELGTAENPGKDLSFKARSVRKGA